MAEVAWVFHFPPSELKRLTLEELVFWHREACRLMAS